MTESSISNRFKIPMLRDVKGVGAAFRQNASNTIKSEFVILLQATVVQGQDNWGNDILFSQQRIEPQAD